jgi:hypothetical protein
MAEILANMGDGSETVSRRNLERCRSWRRDQLDTLHAARKLDPGQGAALVRLLRSEGRLMLLLTRMLNRQLEHRRNLLTPLTPEQHAALDKCLSACSQSLQRKAALILSAQEDSALPTCLSRQTLVQARIAELSRIAASAQARADPEHAPSARSAGAIVATRLLLHLTDDLLDLIAMAEETLLLVEQAGLARTTESSPDRATEMPLTSGQSASEAVLVSS